MGVGVGVGVVQTVQCVSMVVCEREEEKGMWKQTLGSHYVTNRRPRYIFFSKTAYVTRFPFHKRFFSRKAMIR